MYCYVLDVLKIAPGALSSGFDPGIADFDTTKRILIPIRIDHYGVKAPQQSLFILFICYDFSYCRV
jgi:hypothetical protein